MEINRALPTASGLSVSDEALRQAHEYIQSDPICFSFRSSCCGKLRQNSELVDPGYYLNGGPSCQQSRLTCDSPPDLELEAFADGLIPGCIVYAPKTKDQFWPAIIDFSPYEDSHFVIFRIGGPLCCTPYAYYLSFIPDWSGDIFGGWYSADYIVPFDTLVNKRVELEVNFNDPHFDSAYERANKYYAVDLKGRLNRFSAVCRALKTKSRRVRNLQSPGKSIRGKVANQARKFSHEVAKRLASSTYQRVQGAENISLSSSMASSSTSSSETGAIGLAGFLLRKLSLTPQTTVRGTRDKSGEFGVLTLGDLAHGHDHVHPPQELAQPRPGTTGARAGTALRLAFVNPTEHSRCAANEVYNRSAIQAIIRSGVHKIRTYKADGGKSRL